MIFLKRSLKYSLDSTINKACDCDKKMTWCTKKDLNLLPPVLLSLSRQDYYNKICFLSQVLIDMGTGRLEAFSDGVLAIIITIMVLELKVPHGVSITSLKPLYPVLISYILSFVNIGIYWNNHHHLMHSVEQVNGKVMWGNMHLLFWLSLVPFGSGWMGENNFAVWPVAVYGFILAMCAVAYFLLVRALIHLHGNDSLLAKAVGNDKKGRWSMLAFIVGAGLSFVHPLVGFLVYVLVTAMWFLPDRRIEEKIEQEEKEKE